MANQPHKHSPPRRTPAIITYLHPFRLIEAESLWNVTIDQINKGEWDYIKLHEIAGGIDVGLQTPYHLVVARDGALALPPIPELRADQSAVEFFNRCLAAVLLGGIYCEAITLDNIELGSIIDWKFIRVQTQAPGGPNRFHHLIRMRMAPPIEAIALMKPRFISLAELQKAMQIGSDTINKIPTLSSEFLLKGVTGIARRDWSSALSNLWIVVEQLTAYLWEREVLAPSENGAHINGRLDQLKDTRTWTAAARHELLHQKGVVDSELLRVLFMARKARNELAHSGHHPKQGPAVAGYQAVLALLRIAVPGVELPLYSLNLSDHALSDPFAPSEPRKLEPEYWMPIPQLPGEAELEREEAISLTYETKTSE